MLTINFLKRETHTKKKTSPKVRFCIQLIKGSLCTYIFTLIKLLIDFVFWCNSLREETSCLYVLIISFVVLLLNEKESKCGYTNIFFVIKKMKIYAFPHYGNLHHSSFLPFSGSELKIYLQNYQHNDPSPDFHTSLYNVPEERERYKLEMWGNIKCLLHIMKMITYITELLQYTIHLEFGSVAVIDAGSPWFLITSFIYFLEKTKERNVRN